MDARSREEIGPLPFIAAIRNFPCGPIFSECTSFNSDFYSFERHSGMLDWLAGSANLINSDRDVHPADRITIILSLKTPNLDELLSKAKATTRSFAQPGLSEYEPLLIITIKQQLLNPVYNQIFGSDVANKEILIDEVAELIVELDKTYSNSNTASVTVTQLSQLMISVPQINWEAYLNAKFSTNLQWNDTDLILIDSVEAFRELAAIVARTPRRALANYLTFMTALNLRGYLYNGALRTNPLHWRECVEQLAALDATANLYIGAHQSARLNEVHTSLSFMKDFFVTEHSKFPASVREKIRNASLKIGFPQRLLNEDIVVQIYGNYELVPNDYFTSIVTALSRQRLREISQIGSRLGNDDSIRYNILSPYVTYDSYENSFVVPLPFLQYPISLPDDAPFYTVYGTLGVVFFQVLAKVMWDAPESSTLMNKALECIKEPFLLIQGSSTLLFPAQLKDDMIHAVYLSDAINSAVNSYSLWRNQNRIGEEASYTAVQMASKPIHHTGQ
ncbi:unnamed protein product [Enterobius vermicularis]|uniref:Peptidase_M13_N domain-containing protein n=1 Tax=Enterobius vermicularis TaxID=51028 RepID=A0A158QB45_ENTVE|nr:unnamed protein product [Enterobius vermicularis]